MYNNSYFDAPDAHFDKSCLFSSAQAEKVANPKIVKTVKELKNTITECHDTEPNPSKDI
jgi:hypothetical protein